MASNPTKPSKLAVELAKRVLLDTLERFETATLKSNVKPPTPQTIAAIIEPVLMTMDIRKMECELHLRAVLEANDQHRLQPRGSKGVSATWQKVCHAEDHARKWLRKLEHGEGSGDGG